MSSTPSPFEETPEQRSWIGRLIYFCLSNKLIVGLFVLAVIAGGLLVAPFDWNLSGLQRYPVPVDAIPDIGENQQIVFTEWMGRSPQDVEDQVTYPLTVSLLGIPGVKAVRSYSYFGFSTIYVLFKENVEFYWSRSRVLEKLASLPAGTLPQDAKPALGPDATPLGQIFWYTLEGRDPDGRPAGGWDLEELRTIQDWYVRYWLLAADGVAEVASVGGFVREYQVDADPDALRAYRVTITDVARAVQASNIDVGAKIIEINRVEYFIRGTGFIKKIEDIENSVVKVNDNVPVLVKQVAHVTLGPALRRGALDKAGAEAVGGVVVARYGGNPLAVIGNVKEKIAETRDSLPAKAVIDYDRVAKDAVERFAEEHDFKAYTASGAAIDQPAWTAYLQSTPRSQWPDWVTLSRVTVVPFYDRTGLIYETLGTLNEAIALEILVTILVVIVMVLHLRSSLLIASMLPLAVLLCFIGMKAFGVDANIVALSGIVIAIGTIVDMGIVICENILRRLSEAAPEVPRLQVVHKAASEVGSAVLTAVATTVVSFLPVFSMIGSEGKLFKPLAYTKTFALVASILIALLVIPPAAYVLLCGRVEGRKLRAALHGGFIAAGCAAAIWAWWAGAALALFGVYFLLRDFGVLPNRLARFGPPAAWAIAALVVAVFLTQHWEPLGPEEGLLRNLLFVGGLIGGLLLLFRIFQHFYPPILRACLRHKLLFLSLPAAVVLLGAVIWLGFGPVFDFIPKAAAKLGAEPATVRSSAFWVGAGKAFPGLGKEFMPALDEGSFLFMPTTMPHASIGEALEILSRQDEAISSIPEIDSVVGKIGRADSPLDPAPISMIETIVHYKPEYATDENGKRLSFRYDAKTSSFVRDAQGRLIEDPNGRPFRQWRDKIQSPDDIWEEITAAARIPGTTSAPMLQPIAARIVMLQSGMRAPMGVKVKGPSLESIEGAALKIEELLKQVPDVNPATVVADRVVGKPYLEIVPDRRALARYGVPIQAFQDVVEVAIGGKRLTTTVEGRERFGVRVRYPRELRDGLDTLEKILVPGSGGTQIPLGQLAEIRYVRGPQAIKSEDTFLVGYVTFDKIPGTAEVNVVEECQRFLRSKIASGELALPAGVSYTFAGSYENQLRAQKTLTLVLPLALFLIFLIIYLQFRAVSLTLLVFSGIAVAWAGGFLLIWLYGRPWFLDFSLFGVSMRGLFQIHTINLSVAVWVGFLALFGIATDDGVIMGTYQEQLFRERTPRGIQEIRDTVVEAGVRRVRPALMTAATTILALLPVLTSTGRGSDIMLPMAIPSFGGMVIQIMTMLIVPVLYAWIHEARWRKGQVREAKALQAQQV